MHSFSRGSISLKRLIFTLVAIFIPLIAIPIIQIVTNSHFTLRAASLQGTRSNKGATANDWCAQWHVVASGETLSGIASNNGTTWPALAALNHLADPNQLAIGQNLCLAANGNAPTNGTPTPNTSTGAVGQGNFFPYGQCTWWAAQRYYQLHQVYVPWTVNSNAAQWVDRATDFGWQVSDKPSVGSIIVLQPYIQGASALGHVAVVEQVLPNGQVIASNMNWAPDPSAVTNLTFTPGPGVKFIDR